MEIFLTIVKWLVVIVLTFLGMLVVNAFSRKREYRADSITATLTSEQHMIAALEKLEKVHDPERTVPQNQKAYAAMKIAGRGWLEWFSTHPVTEKRIDALRNPPKSEEGSA